MKERLDEDFSVMPESFDSILPRTIMAESQYAQKEADKTATTFSGIQGLAGMLGQMSTYGAGTNILRNPSRRFYDPEITTTAIFLPRTIKQKNRWYRWFYDHDELIGAVLDQHSELPYSLAEILIPNDDPTIQKHTEECLERTKFFSELPKIDLEFMKIGEVFIHTPWDDHDGMWSNIIIHNPDFVEVSFSPLADQECVIELIPSDELKSLVHSTKPETQQLKKRLPEEVVRKVLTGKNIILESDEITHIARRSNPYDVRGTSIISRILRLMMYEDKLREAQITIADNFIYPLKVFKLGDPKKGWIPNETHQRALAQMLQQATFDPNFSLIYHYGLQVDYVTVADKTMRLEKEWSDIAEKKMIALGVGKGFLSGEANYASANVTLQMQLARYKAKRDLFETRWIREKFLKVMAERNEWYKRDKKELIGQYRVSRSAEELRDRIIIPKLVWHKKLMMRDEQSFLTFLNNVYSQGKGPLSAITLLQYMGLSLEEELSNKKKQSELEEKIGALTHPSVQGPTGLGGAGGGLVARFKDKFRTKKGSEEQIIKEDGKGLEELTAEERAFVGETQEVYKAMSTEEYEKQVNEVDVETTKILYPVSDDVWMKNIHSSNVPAEVRLALLNLNNKLQVLNKKYNGDFEDAIRKEKATIIKDLTSIYKKGKLLAYEITDFFPIYREHFSSNEDLTEYTDLLMKSEFEEWLNSLLSMNIKKSSLIHHIRNLANTCFCHGQLKSFQEQGIYNVKIGNVISNDGIRFGIKELLSKGWNLGSLVSPKDEIIILSPCIEGFDEEEFDNNVDPNIKRYKDLWVAGISVKNCPIEYCKPISNFLTKLGKYMKKRFDEIEFVKDVVNTESWEESTRSELNSKYDSDDTEKTALLESLLMYERTKKMGSVPTFRYNKKLIVSNWIGMEDTSLTENLIKYIDVVDDSLEKVIKKVFKKSNFNLTDDEIHSFTVFKYIQAVNDESGNVSIYKINEDLVESSQEIDYRLRQGKIWDASGKCLNAIDKDEMQIFKDNLKMWLDYPHLLTEEIKQSFEAL